MQRKKRTGKWNSIGITPKQRNKITNNVRMKCYTLLKQNHKQEYKELVKKQLEKEYNKVYQEMQLNIKHQNITQGLNTKKSLIN